MKENRTHGIRAEKVFQRRLDRAINETDTLQWRYHPKDTFDFTIFTQEGVDLCNIDVKSTQVSHAFTNSKAKNKQYKIGRFLLSPSQIGKDFYIALYIRYKTCYLFLGIIHSSLFKGSKYLSLHALKRTEPIEIEDFLLGLEV